MATKIAKFKHLTDAQCVRGSITWHVSENAKDAFRWEDKLVLQNAYLYRVDPMTFFDARAGALIYSLKDAKTRVLRRIDELRECIDYCGQ